jgi:hypothetical protein
MSAENEIKRDQERAENIAEEVRIVNALINKEQTEEINR